MTNFYAAVTIVLWGAMPALTKDLLNSLPSFEVLAVSSLFAAMFLFEVNRRSSTLTFDAGKIFTAASLGFVGLFLYSAFFYYGLERLTSQEACVLNYLWPLMIVLFSCPVLGEKLTRRKLLAVGLSFGGVAVVMLGNASLENFSADKFAGAFACVIAAACYGLFSVLNKKIRLEQKFAMMIIWLTTAICSFAAGFFLEQWPLPNARQIFGLLWLGVLVDAVAYLTWALALENSANTARTANLAYLVPILAVFVSTLVFGEELSITVIPALVLILAGIFIGRK